MAPTRTPSPANGRSRKSLAAWLTVDLALVTFNAFWLMNNISAHQVLTIILSVVSLGIWLYLGWREADRWTGPKKP